jgi:hypothetical protein
MSALDFSVVGARAERYGAAPALVLRLRVRETSGTRIDAIALRVQIQLEVQRRGYAPQEQELLEELFGKQARYGDTLRPMLWTQLSAMVLSFRDETELDLVVPCSYDFEVAAHKYFAALKDGLVPLNLLFSGTAFVEGPSGVTPEFVPWNCEARYALPVTVWREAIDAHFPNAAWLRVSSDLFDELRRYKIATGLPTWDAALSRLLAEAKVRA